MWGRCKRYVKETSHGIKVNLGGGLKVISGELGAEVSQEVRVAAERAALYLDYAQHYYCEERKRARKEGNEKREREMERKRDEVMVIFRDLAIKAKERETLTQWLDDNRDKLEVLAQGVSGIEGCLKELLEAYNLIPQKLEELKKGQEAVIKAVEEAKEKILQKLETVLAPPPPKEEIEKQMYALHLRAKDLENSRLHLELGLERLEDKEYEEAIKNLEEALRPLPEDSEARASVFWNLGIALIEWPRGDRFKNLTRAVDAYKKVLKVYTIEKSPERFAGAQNNLGNVYGRLSEVRDKEVNLGLAIRAYHEALRVRTFEGFPQAYAMTQNNLGNAYCGLSGVGDKEANLGLAIRAYNEALRVYTFEGFPQQYATTQNNLGNAYGVLSEVGDKEANLGLAIKAYNEARRVYTFERLPQDYAMTQNNLGTAYGGLSEVRDKEANLTRAIKCFKGALRVFTKEALPWYFVKTSGNLASVLYMMGDKAGALRVMEEMLPVAEEVGHPRLEDYRRFYQGLKSAH